MVVFENVVDNQSRMAQSAALHLGKETCKRRALNGVNDG